MDNTSSRSAREVFEDRLRQGKHGSVEEDFERNYPGDVVVLTGRGAYRAREGLERLARIVREELPDGSFEYRTKLVEGETAFLAWKVGTPRHPVAQGAARRSRPKDAKAPGARRRGLLEGLGNAVNGSVRG